MELGDEVPMHDDNDDSPRSLPNAGSFRATPVPTLEARLNRAIHDRIGWELRKLYEEVLHEPVPKRLLALLRAPGKLH